MSTPRTPFRPAALASALAALLVAACSSGGGSGGGSFAVEACSLGCSGGDGTQIGCGVQTIHVNEDLQFTFSAPVDLSSVTKFSFQVVELQTGKSAPGSFFLKPGNPRVLIFRPQLTFDSAGNPVFGLKDGNAYQIRIPGVNQDSQGPFVRSTGGAPNKDRVFCTVNAAGVLDPKPGKPRVEVFVDQKIYDEPCGVELGEEQGVLANAPGAPPLVDVSSETSIVMVFDDLMNPATLVNPITGQSANLEVLVDSDGQLADPSDQVPVTGKFSISLDQDALVTTVGFVPETPLPSAGFLQENKRKVVVRIGPEVKDLGGNPVENGGDIGFQPECFQFAPTALDEDFGDDSNEDAAASGGEWGFAGGLGKGIAGGSGRLGPLRLAQGQTLVLSTDDEDFSGIDTAVLDPANVIDPSVFGEFDPVTDGIFEFASLRLAAGSVLKFEGTKPARLFVRGEARVRGKLDISGEDAAQHNDAAAFGGPPTIPGPGGGAGGEGGRLPTWINFETVPDTVVPPGVVPPADPDSPELDGRDGDDVTIPAGTLGGGGGGTHWPAPPDWHMPVDPSDVTGIFWDFLIGPCKSFMHGSVGAGGGRGLPGLNGDNKKAFPGIAGTQIPAPPNPSGGSLPAGLGIGSDPDGAPRKLDPAGGWLVGGAGGGGAGAHIAADSTENSGTQTNGKTDILKPDGTGCHLQFSGAPATIQRYRNRSSPAGGAGGGAFQLQAGRQIVIEDGGIVDAGGGAGGVNSKGGGLGSRSSAGGGGAGGAFLAQSKTISIATSGRIDLSGGAGGKADGTSVGGNGGAGLVRLESNPPLLELAAVAPKVLPNPTSLASLGAEPIDIISIGELQTKLSGPDALSGSQSCWLRPQGNHFVIQALEDDEAAGTLGWDMTVLIDGIGPVSYRSPNPALPGGQSPEEFLGTALGASPLVVRFQGVRSIGDVVNLCQVDLSDDTKILAGSLTGWVADPVELNDFFGDTAMAPNMIRYQIVFDRSHSLSPLVLGVDDVTISVQPD